MSCIENHVRNINQAGELEIELAYILQELILLDEPERLQEVRKKIPPPLFIQQARTLSENHVFRNRVRTLLNNNSFVRGEPNAQI